MVPSEKTVQEIVESVLTLLDKEGNLIGGLDEDAKNLLLDHKLSETVNTHTHTHPYPPVFDQTLADAIAL